MSSGSLHLSTPGGLKISAIFSIGSFRIQFIFASRELSGSPVSYLPVKSPDAKGLRVMRPTGSISVLSVACCIRTRDGSKGSFRLLYDRGLEAVSASREMCFSDRGRSPVAGTPVATFSIHDRFIHRLNGFFSVLSEKRKKSKRFLRCASFLTSVPTEG